MANTDVTRIAGNIGALNALNQLATINNQLATYQARLASGKRINSSGDDPSGMSIATSFDVHREGMTTALKSIGDAKNLMATMEGGLQKIQTIMVKMRNKALEAQGSTIGPDEKQAIKDQLIAFRDEINDIVKQTQWNGTALLSGSTSGGGTTNALSFLTNDDVSSGSTTTSFSFAAVTVSGSTVISAAQGFNASAGTSGSVTSTGMGLDSTLFDNITSGSANTVVSAVDNALKAVKAGISQVGSFTARLTYKEESLTVQYTNTEAAYNRIMNANMAEEQVNASKYSILQQTATAMLAQANAAPQFLLSLFR